jgi:hypothetical protein
MHSRDSPLGRKDGVQRFAVLKQFKSMQRFKIIFVFCNFFHKCNNNCTVFGRNVKCKIQMVCDIQLLLYFSMLLTVCISDKYVPSLLSGSRHFDYTIYLS